MIDPTKRRLTLLFTSIILATNILIAAALSVYLHRNLAQVQESRLEREIVEDIVEPFSRRDVAYIASEEEADLLQVVGADGSVPYASKSPLKSVPPILPELLAAALAGNSAFIRQQADGIRFLVLYYPLDREFAARGVTPDDILFNYERRMLVIAAVWLPVILVLSFAVSRYLVHRAMVPILEVFRFQDTFTSNVTHELMSPLTSLKGNLEVAMRRPRSQEDYSAVIRLALREADRIIGLLNDLYLLASSKFKTLELDRQQVDLGQLADDVVRHHVEAMEEKGIALELRTEPGCGVRCDERLMRRTLENLVDNAVRYTPAGGTIAVSTGSQPGQVWVRVQNPAPGATRDAINRWLEPFVRGRQSEIEHIPGKGLGLYISRYVARSHGGELTLAIPVAGLFSVTLRLPAER